MFLEPASPNVSSKRSLLQLPSQNTVSTPPRKNVNVDGERMMVSPICSPLQAKRQKLGTPLHALSDTPRTSSAILSMPESFALDNDTPQRTSKPQQLSQQTKTQQKEIAALRMLLKSTLRAKSKVRSSGGVYNVAIILPPRTRTHRSNRISTPAIPAYEN
jgi:hypothetical protein